MAALRTATLVAGSAYGGAYVYNNVGADGLRGLAADILLRERERLRAGDGGGSAGGAAGGAAAGAGIDRLAEQVERLSGEVSRANGRPVVVYGGAEGAASLWDVGGLAGWTVLAFGVGTAVYYVCVWRDVSLRDFMWVSRKAFSSTVQGINAGMKNVNAAVAAIRAELTEKLRSLEFSVDGVRTDLSKKIEAEVSEVKEGVDGVQDMLHGVNDRMELLDGKLDTATSGIFALVRVVSSMAPEQLPSSSPFAELRRFAEMSDKSRPVAIDGTGVFSRASLPSSSTSFAAAALEAPAETDSPALSRRTSTQRLASSFKPPHNPDT